MDGRYGEGAGAGTGFSSRIHRSGSTCFAAGQARRIRAKWKERVRFASRVVLPEGHWVTSGAVAVTLFYFPDAPMQGDIDNIVKPVLDALARHIYRDDAQVERLVVQKFEPANIVLFAAPTATLVDALSGRKPLLYVRLSKDPFEELS